MTRAVLALGSNLGDRAAHLRTAVAALRPWLIAVSGVYETAPWGDADQPGYLNAVAMVADAGASPRDWLDRAWLIEKAGGRVRDPDRRYGPRTLDIDVIAVWTDTGEPVRSGDPELTLPHPRAHERAFVLRPWIDVEPYGRLPGRGWLTDLLRSEPVASGLADVQPRPDLTLESS
jgi:2-amino-4-hydroxy-6-hydroxymethyldihydropteridine diphosphokinase